MGLKYDSGDSNGLMDALTKNLAQATRLVEGLERANARLVGALDGGMLAGQAYDAARLAFTDSIGPSIADSRRMVDDLQQDLAMYEREDSKVSRFGVLDEDELEAELAAARTLKDDTERLIETHAAAAEALTALPGVGEALVMMNYRLQMIVDQAEQMIHELQEQLTGLREFDAAIAGLFGAGAVGALSAGSPDRGTDGRAPWAEKSSADLLSELEGMGNTELEGYLKRLRSRDSELYWDLLARMSSEDLDRLERSGHLDGLEPTPNKSRRGQLAWLKQFFGMTSPLDDGLNWRTPEHRLMPEYTSKGEWSKLRQVGVADCWLVASLAVEMRDDPDWVARNVSVNPNGTVTVRLLDRVTGERVPVTVTERLLHSNSQRIGISGSDAGAYVEKAAAEFYGPVGEAYPAGSYAAIDADSPSNAVRMFSGRETKWVPVSEGSSELIAAVDDGDSALVTTPAVLSRNAKGRNLKEGHVYVVDEAGDDTIHLLNPWDLTNEKDMVTLTTEEYVAWTNGATIVEEVAK